jgi:hypothetical protein
MTATDYAAIVSDSTAAQALRLFTLFDAMRFHSGSMLTLFESNSPGATDALRAWAEAQSLRVRERIIHEDGDTTHVVNVDIPNGTNISVQRFL